MLWACRDWYWKVSRKHTNSDKVQTWQTYLVSQSETLIQSLQAVALRAISSRCSAGIKLFFL